MVVREPILIKISPINEYFCGHKIPSSHLLIDTEDYELVNKVMKKLQEKWKKEHDPSSFKDSFDDLVCDYFRNKLHIDCQWIDVDDNEYFYD